MVNVFVFGAGGYIGNAIAIAARRAGHKVWGFVRKSDQAKQLKENEIIPVIGDINDPKSYESIFPFVSHIIDSTGFASGDNSKILHDTVFNYAEKEINKSSNRKITFISTSGILVYGKQADGTIIDETTPLNPSFIFGGLIAQEERIIKSDQLNGVIIRPGGVFGGIGGHFFDEFWTYDAKTGDYEYKGNSDKKWGFIHIVDLSELYVKIIEAPSSTVAHQIFNAVNDTPYKVIDIRTAMAKAAGATGKLIHVPAGADPFSAEREHSMILSNKKAKTLFGWKPKFDFISDMPLYYQGWKVVNPSK